MTHTLDDASVLSVFLTCAFPGLRAVARLGERWNL